MTDKQTTTVNSPQNDTWKRDSLSLVKVIQDFLSFYSSHSDTWKIIYENGIVNRQ